MRIFLTLVLLSVYFLACNKKANQTVDSAYLPPVIPELKYSFTRNGMNSVDISEVDIMSKTIAYLYSRFIKSAAIHDDIDYETFKSYYEQTGNSDLYGNRGLKPKENIALSNLYKKDKTQITKDIQDMIDSTKNIAEYKTTNNSNNSSKRKYLRVKQGGTGSMVGDIAVLGYADTRGLVVAEAWMQMLIGAVALDKIMNIHLDASVLNNPELRKQHSNLKLLLRGGNYTELEHHLDLAYGYYHHFFNSLTKAEHLILLRGSEQKMINAFTLARTALGREDYAEMWQQIRTIRSLLSQVIATHILNLLVGENTLATLKSQEPSYAFPFISRAYGMIYALQFTRKADGQPYFSYTEINNILKSLLKHKEGFWNTQHLLANAQTPGSLQNIAQKISQPFNISISQLR